MRCRSGSSLVTLALLAALLLGGALAENEGEYAGKCVGRKVRVLHWVSWGCGGEGTPKILLFTFVHSSGACFWVQPVQESCCRKGAVREIGISAIHPSRWLKTEAAAGCALRVPAEEDVAAMLLPQLESALI